MNAEVAAHPNVRVDPAGQVHIHPRASHVGKLLISPKDHLLYLSVISKVPLTIDILFNSGTHGLCSSSYYI
jgi:hypothetical protein